MFVFQWSEELDFVLSIKHLSNLKLEEMLLIEEEDWKKNLIKIRIEQNFFQENQRKKENS